MLSSNIIGYLLKIATLIFLLNLILFLIKDGKTKSTIKLVFSCIILIYAISPVVNLKNCENEQITFSTQVNLDNDFLLKNSLIKKEKSEQIISNYLQNSKILYKTIDIYVNDNTLKIEKVDITLEKDVINGNSGHILFIEDIRKMISNILCIKSEFVNVEYA